MSNDLNRTWFNTWISPLDGFGIFNRRTGAADDALTREVAFIHYVVYDPVDVDAEVGIPLIEMDGNNVEIVTVRYPACRCTGERWRRHPGRC